MKDNAPNDVLDEYLVLRSQGGDPEAFQLLVERWHFRFIRHAFRYTKSEDAAHDVVQDTWMAMIRTLSALNDPRRFRAWSYRIVANKARDWVRREQVRRRTDADPPSPDTVDSAHSDDDITTIREGIQQLEPDQRLVLTWFYLEDMSVRDIADALSIPIGTVKSRLFNARNTLRARLMEKR